MTVNEPDDTRLGKSVLPLVHAHPGKSGVAALAHGRDAFAARVLLADAAERSLDVQYYIWHNDVSGTLLFEALRRAADRGVRVRLLLDDNNTTGLDEILAALDAHSHIEVRLFNPFFRRRWRALGYLCEFARLNRRMHNKSFIADSHVTIIGGRNVGDEYFGAGQSVLFVDLDVLAVGPVVNEVSSDFERYWQAPSAYAVGRLLPPASPEMIVAIQDAAKRVAGSPAAATYREAVDREPFVQRMLAGQLRLEWAMTRMVSDDPAKVVGRAKLATLLWTQVKDNLQPPQREFALVSPYFVPGAAGVEHFVGMVESGVKVTILTNSLEATDVVAVHAGYAKRRKALLKGGVVLFEMKSATAASVLKARHLAGSSSSSLHAKTFSVDRSDVFIGSFNFDPRSARLNTELGFLINSPALAAKIADATARESSGRAYRVCLTVSGALRWIEQRDGQELVHEREPAAGFWLRVAVIAISFLPIEWLL